MAEPMIAVRNLNLSFGEDAQASQVLFDVNFEVNPGEIFGLVGESGSGKTTVLKCLAGLFTHWQGELAINGAPLAHEIGRERCRLVQMVFQDPYGSLHPRHTIGDILEEPLHIHQIGQQDKKVCEMLEKVGLSRAYRSRYPHQLSGGQRQRVAIARALILQPRVLLLDEPTSALDPISTAKIEELISELKQDYTITIVTHNMQQAARCSDYTAYMYLGELVEFGETDQIFMKPARKETQDYITGRFG